MAFKNIIFIVLFCVMIIRAKNSTKVLLCALHLKNCSSCLDSSDDCMFHTLQISKFKLKYICWPTGLNLWDVIRHTVVRSDNETCPEIPSELTTSKPWTIVSSDPTSTTTQTPAVIDSSTTTQTPAMIDSSTTQTPAVTDSTASNLIAFVIIGFLIGIILCLVIFGAICLCRKHRTSEQEITGISLRETSL